MSVGTVGQHCRRSCSRRGNLLAFLVHDMPSCAGQPMVCPMKHHHSRCSGNHTHGTCGE